MADPALRGYLYENAERAMQELSTKGAISQGAHGEIMRILNAEKGQQNYSQGAPQQGNFYNQQGGQQPQNYTPPYQYVPQQGYQGQMYQQSYQPQVVTGQPIEPPKPIDPPKPVDPPAQQAQQHEPPEKHPSRMGEFGKRMGNNVANSMTHGFGFTIGSDVANSLWHKI